MKYWRKYLETTKKKRQKTLRNRITEALVLRGDRKQYMKEIKFLEWASKEEIAAWQADRLEAVLTDARKNIPYYRERATGDRLADFPVLTRSEIKDHSDKLVAPGRADKTTITETTSGTTSVPVSFLLDLGHRERGAVQKSFFSEWAGLQLGDSMVKFWGIFSAEDWKLQRRINFSHWLRNMTIMSSLDMRAKRMEEFAREIQRIQPKLIICYANSMKEFANYLERNGIAMNYHGNILSSTSSLTPEKYDAIYRVFQCPIFDRYGSREMIDMACDCDRHEGLHVSPYMHVVEILDEKGKPCPPGQMGRVVVTQLFNPVMPLIRYELGDYATWAENPCSCGRNWPMLKQIDGRAISVFWHRDGGRFSSYFFVYYVNLIIGQNRIQRQQIVQEDFNRFTIRLVMEDSQNWTDREDNRLRLMDLISEQIGEPVELEFELVDEIPNQPSGKFLQAITKMS